MNHRNYSKYSVVCPCCGAESAYPTKVDADKELRRMKRNLKQSAKYIKRLAGEKP